MRHFCTAFDRNYVVRGLTLRRSLAHHAGPFTLWVLCHDAFTVDLLVDLDLPDVRPVSVTELERLDPELRAARNDRTLIEYYFTCSPSWPLHLLDRVPEIESVTYLDADLFFYSSPEPVFEEMGDASVMIVPHRFPDVARWKERYGMYNVGLVSFRNDDTARACLHWWRERCLEWCHDRVEPGRYGDQKYLDEWPRLFPGVHVLQHPGAGLGPWNWMRSEVVVDVPQPAVDGEPLIFYHFHGLKIFHRRFYDTGIPFTEDRLPRQLRNGLYGRYIAELATTAEWVGRELPDRPMRFEDRSNLRLTGPGLAKRVINALVTRLR